ncbi:hypothetical protein [Acutalibacter sp. 1XD8-36]|uniref:hypothetical protein n=1 Tax=Acutalibacter sp. 1XD8-36 TaxID=2320852 RepID=UPI00261C7CAE|nr:hypothetical protein [Acutalibacter sp. 1XD8-36]
MTKDLLEDYPHICRRIKRMEEAVMDSVEGSSSEFPYTKHTISVQGVPEPGPDGEAALRELWAKRREIEQWVEALPTERERALVELHALKGLRWAAVFRETGYRSPDAARKQYERILKKYL